MFDDCHAILPYIFKSISNYTHLYVFRLETRKSLLVISHLLSVRQFIKQDSCDWMSRSRVVLSVEYCVVPSLIVNLTITIPEGWRMRSYLSLLVEKLKLTQCAVMCMSSPQHILYSSYFKLHPSNYYTSTICQAFNILYWFSTLLSALRNIWQLRNASNQQLKPII